MQKLMPTDIVEEVREVLLSAADAGKYGRAFLTAYQILELLPPATRDRLIAERGIGGSGGGSFTAPSVVSQAAEMQSEIEMAALDVRGMTARVASNAVTPGAGIVAAYRLAKKD
ncbi:MAG TPA: hypothetical protein VNC50_19935 [Planctomycetia bacterium]|nr:hypothetical protein [Planctomycetia bacterium]